MGRSLKVRARLSWVRGFLIGVILLPALVVSILSLRPGGLRQQLRHAARRLRVALTLAGVYLVGSAVLYVLAAGTAVQEFGLPALAVGLSLVFLVLARDPPSPTAR
jgi:hypothetical protein